MEETQEHLFSLDCLCEEDRWHTPANLKVGISWVFQTFSSIPSTTQERLSLAVTADVHFCCGEKLSCVKGPKATTEAGKATVLADGEKYPECLQA
jgi:hypothetical protein